MTRPAAGEWSVLDEDDDPIPGDPDALIALRDAYRELASVTQEAFQLLNGSGDIDGGIGKAMDAYRALYGEVPKRLNDMANAYGQASDAYSRYMPSLEEAQSMSLTALEQARAARQEQSSADTLLATINATIQAVGGPPPTEETKADLQAAQNRQAESSQELDRAKSLLGQAIALRDQAAAAASEVLYRMGDLAPQRSIWEKIADAFEEFFDFLVNVLAEWLTIVLDVLSTIAGFIFPPLGWALGALSSGIEILVAVLENDMVALGIALGGLALSFVPGGKILKNVIKFSDKLSGSIKAGLSNVTKNFADGAGRNIDIAIPPPKTVTAPGGSTRALNTPPRPNAQPNADKVVAGDPIDVASGRMLLSQTDLTIEGALPLVFTRTHVSSYRAGGWFGPSWSSTVDQRLEVDAQGITFVVEDGTLLAYPHPEDGEVLPEEGPRWPLRKSFEGGYVVRQPGRELHFLPQQDNQVLPIAAMSDHAGNRVEFSYDDEGTIAALGHSSGSVVEVRSENGRVTALVVVGPDGEHTQAATYCYDTGNLVEVVDASGGATKFRYGTNDGTNDRIVRWDDSNGMWYEYFYDDRNRCVRTRGAEGFLSYRLEYGDRRTVVTDSLGRATVYEINEACQVVSETNAAGAAVSSTWDRYDRLLSRADPLGNTTHYDYDEAGNLVRVTGPDGTQTSAEYLAPDLPSRYVLPDGGQWSYEYDEDGRRTAQIDPTGARTTFSYDGYVKTTVDPLGRQTSTEYNAAGLPVRVVDVLGARTVISYDTFGRASEVTDPVGATTRITWGANGKPAEVARRNGVREAFSYDGEGNLVRLESQGSITSARYGHFDVPVSIETPVDGRIEYSYDTESRMTGVTNALGLRWHYEYGAAGAIVREVDFDGREQRFSSDALGRVTELHNASGQSVHVTWDAHGRPVTRRTDEGLTSFEHDAAGRVVRACWPGGELSRTYDALGRLLTETINGRTLSNEYDAAGRRIRRTTPSGAESAWRHRAGDQPVALSLAGRTVEFGYNALGQQTRRAVGSVELTQEWANGRLRTQNLNGQQRAYTYRPDGALIGVTDARGDRRYEVDGPGRVVAVRGGAAEERYVYDESGLLTESVLGAHVYDGMQLRSAGGIRYDHDADGRVVRRADGDRVWRLRWDALDQLVAVITPEGEHWQYHYDPFGRRIAKQRVAADGAEILDRVEFTWDATDLAEQRHDGIVTVWDGHHQVERAGDQPWDDARFRFVVADFVGTPSDLVEEDGTVSWHAEHTLWGLGFAGEDGTPVRFPGQYHDEETGLHYNHYRYYDPAAGRYTSKDPLGLTAAADPRSYVLNPTGWVDPLGLAPCPIAEFNKIHNTPEGPSLILRGPDHHRKLDFPGRGPGANKFTDQTEFSQISGPFLPPAQRGKVVLNEDGISLSEFNNGTSLLTLRARDLATRNGIDFDSSAEALEKLGRSDPKTRNFWEMQDIRDRHVANQSVDRNRDLQPDPQRNADTDAILQNTNGRVENVTGLLNRFDGVAIGGSHGPDNPAFDVLKNNMGELRAQGVNKIFMESLRNDAHGAMVNDFLRTGNMDPKLDRFLNLGPNNQEVRQVLDQARAHNIDVIGIGGNPARNIGGADGLFRRHAMLNALGAESVEFHQRQNPGKFVMELGAKHLATIDRPNPINVGGVDLPGRSAGIGDMVGAPSLLDNGAGGFRRVGPLDSVL